MAELIRLYEENPNPKDIKRVVDVLKKGGLSADLKGIWRDSAAVRDFRYWTL